VFQPIDYFFQPISEMFPDYCSRNYQRKTTHKVCTSEMLNVAQQRLAEGYSKRRIATDFGITEAALRQRLKKVRFFKKYERLIKVFNK
jgi:hypothetical protein